MDGCSRFMVVMYHHHFSAGASGNCVNLIFAFAMCWGEYLYALVNVTTEV